MGFPPAVIPQGCDGEGRRLGAACLEAEGVGDELCLTLQPSMGRKQVLTCRLDARRETQRLRETDMRSQTETCRDRGS